MKLDRLHQVLESWRSWPVYLQCKPTLQESLSRGRSNASYLINADGELMTLRLDGDCTEYLGMDRAFEEKVLTALAKTGMSHKLIFSSREQKFSVFSYVKGRAWSMQDFLNPQQRRRLTQLITQIQSITIGYPVKDYGRYLDNYIKHLDTLGLPLAQQEFRRYLEFRTEIDTFFQQEFNPVLSHHDLVPENIIETSGGLTLIDWEYASMTHPDFDHRYIESQLLNNPRELLDGGSLNKLIYWTNYLWERTNKAALPN